MEMNAVRRRPAAGRKKKTANGRMRRGRPEPFFARQVPTIGRCRAVARTDSRVGRPAVRFDHSPFEYDGRLSRATNNEPRATNNGFPRTQMRRCRDKLKPTTTLREPQRVAGRLGRTSPTISHTGDGNERSSQVAGRRSLRSCRSQKNGQWPSPTETPDGANLRAKGHSRRCCYSEFVAAQRHLNPRRPANCDLRPAFFHSMNDERPTMNVKSAVFMRQRFFSDYNVLLT